MDVAHYLRTLARARARTARAKALTGRRPWRDAAVLWEQVVDANPVDGNHWAWLAEAREGIDDLAGAAAAYEQVFEIGAWHRDEQVLPLVFPGGVAYRIAGCAARTGDRARALEWLRRARDLGYRDLERAATDDDLASVRDDPQFREIVGLVDAPDRSREQGWRDDLRLFSREVKRRAPAPFRHGPERDFDAAVEELDRAVPELTDAQVIVELHKLLRRLGDGHAFVRVPEERYPQLRRALPLQLYWFEEGLFVTAADPEHAPLLGAQVRALDGRPVEEVVAAIDPLLSRDNAYGPRQHAPNFLRVLPLLHALGVVPDPDRVTLSVRGLDGGEWAVEMAADADPDPPPLPCPSGWAWLPESLAGSPAAPLPRYLRHCALPYWFDYLPGHATVYCQLNNVLDHPDEPLADFYPRLFGFVDAHPVEKLVLDLRFNGGGNTFLAMPLLHRLIACEKINQRGRLFVIIGRRTFSAAQNTATLIGRHAHPVYVGEPTGSRPTFVGETIPFTLPYSGLTVNVSDLLWQSSWPMDHRAWIAPDLYTPPTFEAFRRNQDPALDAVLAYPGPGHGEHLPGS